MLITGVAHGRGGHGAHGFDVQALVLLRHGVEHAADHIHGFLADPAAAEDARAQPRDLALGGENAWRLPVDHFGRLHANRIASYVDGGITRHPNAMIAARFFRPAH